MSSVFYREAGVDYPVADRTEGMYLIDSAGMRYLDMSGGAAVSCLGHGHKDVIAAIKEQIDRLAFAHTGFFTNEPQEDLARRLSERFAEPGARVYFSSGGSEANETALKLAWQYWRARNQPEKTAVISRHFSYHGNTMGALSVSGSAFRRLAYENVIHDWPRIAPCYAYRHKNEDETETAYGLRAAAELEKAIDEFGEDKIAAFIAEPIVGATLGVVPAVDGYFSEIRRICSERNILLIVDEVMCGSGRCGDFFAHEVDRIIPDIVTMAKGLGGGYQPIAAALVRQPIAEALDTAGGFVHGHTYIGHATACAAGVAVQKYLDEYDVLTDVKAKGRELHALLRERFGSHPNVGDIRSRGLFAGLEFVADKQSKEPFPAAAKIAAKLKATAMHEGLICYPGSGSVDGKRGAHILLAPPFIVESKHMLEMADKLDAVFRVVLDS